MKELSHKLWLAEFRINDLLTEVHPERWKLSEVARLLSLDAVEQSLGEAERSGLLSEVESLRAELVELRGSLGPASSH